MTNKTPITSETNDNNSVIRRPARSTRRFSPVLCPSALALVVTGIASGWVSYLDRSPALKAHAPGTSAWTQQFIVAAVACALYGVALWRHRRRYGRRSGRPLLLAPLGRPAAARLAATMRQPSWRTVAALPPLAVIAYGCWRIGEQVTAGLDPNFTVDAWGGPTYLGAMACHYLDAGLGIALCAWLLHLILLPAPQGAE